MKTVVAKSVMDPQVLEHLKEKASQLETVRVTRHDVKPLVDALRAKGLSWTEIAG